MDSPKRIIDPDVKIANPSPDINFKEFPDDDWKNLNKRRFEYWARSSGTKVDGNEFTYANHNYLFPLYQDRSEDIRMMKAAQMGATVYMVMKMFHMGLYPESWGFNGPIKLGFYFPDGGGVGRLVKDRILPMMHNSPELQPWANERQYGIRPIGDSTIYFLYMGGTSTKDSVPMNVLFIDEVRLMNLGDVFQTYARLYHSHPYKYKHHVSTAGYPEDDIHALFLDSDRKWWNTQCTACNTYQSLPKLFPDCIATHTFGPRKGQSYFICKKCRKEIKDTQTGGFIAENPGHKNSGYQISQLNSRLIKPSEIMEQYENTTNRKEFYNSVLGIPFVDKENKPVTQEALDSCVDPILQWGATGSKTYMGIDQMMGLNYVVILERHGKKRRLVWFEIIENEEPWRRTGQLMEEFNVEVCVCDALPNANEALAFAKHFGRRVFLAFSNNFDDQVRWEEGKKIKSGLRQADKETYHRYKVFLDSYKSIGWTLDAISSGRLEWPDPDALFCDCSPYKGGRYTRYNIMRTHAYPMFLCPVRERVVVEEQTKKVRMRWHYIGIDPHALDALNFAIFAAERKIRSASLAF